MVTITGLKDAFNADTVESGVLYVNDEPKGRALTILRLLPDVDISRISGRQERLLSDGGFASSAYVTIALLDDASYVAGRRQTFDFAWSRRQWAEMDAGFFDKVEALLARRFTRAIERNEARRVKLEGLSTSAMVQQDRERAILARQPTDAVDAWIIANMGYTAETLAALGKATRRDRRREARRQMKNG